MDLANASKPIPTANKVPAKVHPASIARPTPGTPKATDNTTATADVMGDAIKSGTGSSYLWKTLSLTQILSKNCYDVFLQQQARQDQ